MKINKLKFFVRYSSYGSDIMYMKIVPRKQVILAVTEEGIITETMLTLSSEKYIKWLPLPNI